MFGKILIANRGEIAVRIARSCRELGVASVAVHSEADSDSLHVRVADEAVDLGDGPATENYLNIEKVVSAAVEAGAEAVHPGYGFLSENEDFARAVAEAGLVFIGPSPEAIHTMGGKVEARAVAIAADVPLAPGSRGTIDSADSVVSFGDEHGYPVLVKASAGGGGRGMRRINSSEEAPEAFDAAVREATAAFGNGAVYLERYLTNARHVEVQVFADTHGTTVYIGDRDCSVQRRHQKLVEESPAPGLSDEMRRAMGESAVRLAQQVGYVGAGTVEFMVEGEKFYFLEMNTRIQVEHPVTELVHGVDLVAEQLRVASGEHLSITDRLTPRGASIEARINAEDVAGGLFLPAPGTITALRPPQEPNVRFDAGYESGDTVLPYYDSLVGKLIAFGETREVALDRLVTALEDIVIEGIETTIPAALAVTRHPDFRSMDINTLWLESSVDFDAEPEDRQSVEVAGRYFFVPVFSDYGGGAGYGAPSVTPSATPAAIGGPRRGPAGGKKKAAVGDGTIKAPMQGTVVKVNVEPGQTVSKGEVLFVLEAMKMENPLTAPFDGVVGEISVQVGESLAAGTLLTKVESEVAA